MKASLVRIQGGQSDPVLGCIEMAPPRGQMLRPVLVLIRNDDHARTRILPNVFIGQLAQNTRLHGEQLVRAAKRSDYWGCRRRGQMPHDPHHAETVIEECSRGIEHTRKPARSVSVQIVRGLDEGNRCLRRVAHQKAE